MINAFNISKIGAKNYQLYLDAIANNIANTNTDAYKTQNVSFSDLIYTQERGTLIQTGNGSKVTVWNDMTQGGAAQTDYGVNILIDGDGFFSVGDLGGNVYFTRVGSFTIGQIEQEYYLMTKEGDFVLDENLNTIRIDNIDEELNFVSPGNQNDNAISLGLFSFSSPEYLIPAGEGKFIIPEDSAIVPILDNLSKITMDFRESSNVNLALEMSKLISAQRGFQLNAQMIRSADEMEQFVINLRN